MNLRYPLTIALEGYATEAPRPAVRPLKERPPTKGSRTRTQTCVVIGTIALAICAVGRHALAEPRIIERPQAEQIARQKGWTIRTESPQFGTIELQRIVNGIPLYYTTFNANAADTISTDECLPGGLSGLNLTGAGVRLGIWDGGAVRLSHVEFGGRAIQIDGATGFSHHATHVGGTMVASGVWPSAKGMSPSAQLDCFDWGNDNNEMSSQAAGGLRVSNHSYGFVTGWSYDWNNNDWYWYGDVTVSETEDYYFGYYSFQSQEWDQIAQDYPQYLFVTSAGNDRDDGPFPGTGHYFFDPAVGNWAWSNQIRNVDGNSGYDSVAHQSTSKNGLTVGAVEDVIGGYAGPGSVAMTSFSCWGPCDDGRIKPDVVGNGYQLLSSIASGDSDYSEFSGTSMASPNVAGSLGLLLEHYRNTHPSEGDMLSATLKALVIHTADETGPANGPDYMFGWGLVNTHKAAEVITTDATQPRIITEAILVEGETLELVVTTSGLGGELWATIVWTDPPAESPFPSLDAPDKMLVNDLDLRITSRASGMTYLPWVLDPAVPFLPAVTGDNNTDNVEQVIVYSPGAATFDLRVTHKGSLSGGSQTFGLVVTGADAVLFDCNDNAVDDSQDLAGGTSQDCNVNTIPDECDIERGTSNDCNTNGIPDECEFVDCNENCVPDDEDLSGGTSQDCNANSVPDECDVAAQTSDDCNGNGIPDECDLDSSDPDGNGEVSPDCNGNGFPDECDVADSLLVYVDFESGLPAGWDIAGNFQVTDLCRVDPVCDGNAWAYAGNTASCTYGDRQIGTLTSPLITLGSTESELRFCALVDTEANYDFADVFVNGDRVSRESGQLGGWSDRVINLSPYREQAVTITFRFTSDMSVSGTLGWQVDKIQVICGAQDCNSNGVPDECDITAGTSDDDDGNGVPDECQCQTDSECYDDVYCNGLEQCVHEICRPGGDPCPGQICLEDTDECVDCVVDEDCDDGLFCTGEETCVNHVCESSGDPCTSIGRVCDEQSDSCLCDDNGDCDDGIACTADSCDTDTGQCVFTPDNTLCDDGNPCTDDVCHAVNGCQSTSNDANSCDDGVFCNGAETCSGGSCVVAGAIPCHDSGFCSERDKACLECLDGSHCDDGDDCTVDTCPGGTCAHALLPACQDDDEDGILNRDDECPGFDDAVDADGDGVADGCDDCPNDADNDADDDGVCGNVDNCPEDANSGQEDADGDEIGDVCDECPNDANDDSDDDGLCGDVDNCPDEANSNQEDADEDGIGDACDDCPYDPDNDTDGDGICGDVDNCPANANPNQGDADDDGIGNACDACPNDADDDADDDGVCGDVDQCPDTPVDETVNADGCADSQLDDDGDGVFNNVDECPDTPADEEVDEEGCSDLQLRDEETGAPVPSGTACGVFGMIPLGLTFMGLVAMRRRAAGAPVPPVVSPR